MPHVRPARRVASAKDRPAVSQSSTSAAPIIARPHLVRRICNSARRKATPVCRYRKSQPAGPGGRTASVTIKAAHEEHFCSETRTDRKTALPPRFFSAPHGDPATRADGNVQLPIQNALHLRLRCERSTAMQNHKRLTPPSMSHA